MRWKRWKTHPRSRTWPSSHVEKFTSRNNPATPLLPCLRLQSIVLDSRHQTLPCGVDLAIVQHCYHQHRRKYSSGVGIALISHSPLVVKRCVLHEIPSETAFALEFSSFLSIGRPGASRLAWRGENCTIGIRLLLSPHSASGSSWPTTSIRQATPCGRSVPCILHRPISRLSLSIPSSTSTPMLTSNDLQPVSDEAVTAHHESIRDQT